MQQSDEQLVSRVKNGDFEAFEELVARHERKIYRLVRRLLQSESDVEDLLQEIFLQVWQKVDTFEGRAAFSSWLYRVAVNACYMYLRKTSREKLVSIEDAMPRFTSEGKMAGPVRRFPTGPEYKVLQKEMRQALEAAIGELPEDYRIVLVLRDVEGLQASEVAELLDLSVPAVKSRLHRARVFLRQRLAHYFAEGEKKSGLEKAKEYFKTRLTGYLGVQEKKEK